MKEMVMNNQREQGEPRDEAMLGLDRKQVEESRTRHGENILTPPQRVSLWQLYLEKYKDPMVRILLVAAAVSLVLAIIENDFVEVIGIFLAIFLATTIGFYFERDAARRFDMLNAMGEEQPVKVMREGKVTMVAKREVVVGDVVLLEVGDEVPADGRLTAASSLQIDESALTGEPIATKQVEPRESESTYPVNVVLRSTLVMGGHGRMTVTAVGDETEIGKVARTASEQTDVKTPLNLQLEKLAGLISKVGSAVAVAAFVLFLGHDILTQPLWHSHDYLRMAEVVLRYFMMAVTLLVMAVPEGLPMAVTLALALNMRRMLKSNNLVRKLHACETMGAVTVICTDKTGTLTQNKMQVRTLTRTIPQPAAGTEKQLAQAIALNTTAELDGDKVIGNPTEGALLLWLRTEGVDYRSIRQLAHPLQQIPFSTERKYMVTRVALDDGVYEFIKGGPEIVMPLCCSIGEQEGQREQRQQELDTVLAGYQGQAMRTIALAYRRIDDAAQEPITVGRHYHLQALFGISDPLREEVPQAVANCAKAGIQVKIVTGDTQATAMEIARQIGIGGDNQTSDGQNWTITGPDFAALTDEQAVQRARTLRVMSRARPTDKQRLVNLLQQQGEVVAVTGDGTNDAPALNHAHVGLSLGSGTSVAKNASDITLIDDSFASIVHAVMWGRSLYRNIQRFIFFQLVVNVTALLLVLGGSLIGTELPLTITQMLWINLIMDTFAAMALASLPPSREVLGEKPRRSDAFIITRPMAMAILSAGLFFFAVLMTLLYYFECVAGVSLRELTIFFTVFVMMQWWNLWNAKALGSSHSAFHRLWADGGLLFVLAVILLGQWVIVTFGGKMFRTEPLDAATWLWIIAATSPVMWGPELIRMFRRLLKRS